MRGEIIIAKKATKMTSVNAAILTRVATIELRRHLMHPRLN